jgi:hypothetical protein
MNHQFFNSFLLLILTLPPASLQATPVAGAITGLHCLHDHYLLTRSGQPTNLPVQIFTEVREGDTIAIHANQPALHYRDDQLNLQTVTYQQLPFTMPTAGKELEPSCDFSLYTVKHQGHPLPSLPSVLQAKDVIDLLPDQPMLQLQLGSQSVITDVKYKDLAYTVHATGEVPTIKNNLVTWLGQWLTQAHENQLQQAVILRTRGETENATTPPSIPVLAKAKPEQQLVAGERLLELAWKGGKAPFTLTLAHAGHTQVLATNLQTQWIRQRVSLSPGKYQLLLQDTQTKEPVKYQFTVITQLPSFPDELSPVNLSTTNLRLVTQAAWLASQEEEKWLWEAYQQVVILADNYSPVRTLKTALEQGQRIAITWESQLK